MGFSHLLNMNCSASGWSTCTYTSLRVLSKNKPEKSKKKTFEVNMRAVIRFREIGFGFSSMKSFSRCMNLNCLTLNGFQIVRQDVMTAYKEVANNSMKKAATELQNGDDTKNKFLSKRYILYNISQFHFFPGVPP